MRFIFIAILISFLIILPLSYGQNAASPCQKYSCFDTSNPNFECPKGLVKIRGWCPGPNKIQMCGLVGTPEGPYLRTPEGIATKQKLLKGEYVHCGPVKKETNLPEIITNDFEVTITGDGGCSYKVENNGKTTRDWTGIECDSKVTITVGSGKDCQESGECIVWSDGGVIWPSFRVGTYQVSVTKCKPPKDQYTCMDTGLCKAKGGKSVPRLCPGLLDYQCCVFDNSLNDGGDSDSSNGNGGFDSSKPINHFLDLGELATNDNTIKKVLSDLYKKKDVIVVIETVKSIGEDRVNLLSRKFKNEHNLDSGGIPALNIVIIYGKKENRFVIGHVGNCNGYSENEINNLITADQKSLVQKSDYNNAFYLLANSISNLISSKNPASITCSKDNVIDCSSCGSGIVGSILGCTENTCKKLPGCSYNKKYQICTEIDVHETVSTIPERLNSVKNGFQGFIRRDPICRGANCAQYVTRVHDYIFGIGKHFVAGVDGNAWNMPKNIEKKGGTAIWFDWRNGEVFGDYDSLYPGDIIGFYYSGSDYRADKEKGRELGNTPDIDFTHVVLYLGKRVNEHIITHLYHPPGSGSEGIRTESIENFLGRYGSLFKIRVVMKPDRERLYRVPDENYKPTFELKKIEEGVDFRSLVPKSYTSISSGLSGVEDAQDRFMWLTADINSLVENVNIERYAGKTIRVPQNLPNKYIYQYPDADLTSEEEALIARLEAAIQKFAKNRAREWAIAIVKNAKYKKPEYITLITSFVKQESAFNENPNNLKEIGSKLWYRLGFDPQGPTLGCMQIRLCKAVQLANLPITDQNKNKIYNEIITVNGCLLYGNKYLEEIAGIYVPSGNFDENNLMYIAGDYAAGAYSSRNAAFQKQINELIGTKLVLDGDLLKYDDNCPANPVETSNTELALREFIKEKKLNINDVQLKDMLKKEKTKAFESQSIYKEVKKAWKEIFKKEPEYAIVPDAKKRKEGSSITYAKATKINYNSLCVQLPCQNPSQVAADVDALHRGQAATS